MKKICYGLVTCIAVFSLFYLKKNNHPSKIDLSGLNLIEVTIKPTQPRNLEKFPIAGMYYRVW